MLFADNIIVIWCEMNTIIVTSKELSYKKSLEKIIIPHQVTIFINNKSVTFRHAQRRVKLQFTLNLHIEEQPKAELDQQEHTLLYISLIYKTSFRQTAYLSSQIPIRERSEPLLPWIMLYLLVNLHSSLYISVTFVFYRGYKSSQTIPVIVSTI